MKYIINNNTFELKDIFECGQCFRWNEEDNGSYTGIFKNCVLNVEKENDKIIFDGDIFENMYLTDSKFSSQLEKEEAFKNAINNYFDLNRDYEEIKKKLSKIDDNLKTSISYGKGIRILNQDLFETIISFIISANNNIPRIKKIIERLSENYGKEVIFNGKKYYTFPNKEDLKKASVNDFRNLGLGFRDVRVYNTTRKIANNEFDLNRLYNMKTEDVANELLTLDGVGPKVCDCILLFSDLKRFDVFPIDVWVRRVMNELYIHNEDEKKVNKKEIRKLADEKFGALEGIAQQYLFYWKREA